MTASGTEHSINPLFSLQKPVAQAAGPFIPLTGQTGQSFRTRLGGRDVVFRYQPDRFIPGVCRQREYRLLRKLAGTAITVPPLAGDDQALIMPWQAGEMLDLSGFQQQRPAIITLVSRLHHNPPTGYRLPMVRLLWQYWQCCRYRHPAWLRTLKHLTREGEPVPLRLAPLHMDIHPGNVLSTAKGLRLIDWEYAGDGDVALELAAICAADPEQAAQWRDAYAEHNQIAPERLYSQILRWQPWLNLLMAGWYQLRAEQSGDTIMAEQANQAWQTV